MLAGGVASSNAQAEGVGAGGTLCGDRSNDQCALLRDTSACPDCAAEVSRSLQQRRIDWPMCAAICVGMAGFAATWPFLQALNVFRKNYYNLGKVGLKNISRAY